MKPVNAKYTFPFAVFTMLFAQHIMLKKWSAQQSLPFWLALAGFLAFLGLTLATFYKSRAVR